MADNETHSSRAEQRMAAVAKLKRAASLPRMKDGRRPPMPVEAFSEGEKPPTPNDEENISSEGEKSKSDEEQAAAEVETEVPTTEGKERTPEPKAHSHPERPADTEIEPDTEPDERPMSPSITKKRRSRSRSRSRGSKDFKGKARATQSPIPPLGGDSSQDENSHLPSPIMLPMVPPLASPMPHFPFLQQPRFLPSPTPVSPDMSLFYPGTSPPTPLPTLEDLRNFSLMRSNSAGSSAAGRRLAMHKLTGGTETYDPSPSPTPPPSHVKLSRNNTVSGGERIAARQNLLNRLGTRLKEADAEATSGAEDRSASSPTPKRRRRRSRRTSGPVNPVPAVSDSEINSTNPNTPAIPSSPLPTLHDTYAELRAQSATPSQLQTSHNHINEHVCEGTTLTPPPVPLHANQRPPEEHERPELHRRRSVLVEDQDDDEQNPPQTYVNPGTPQRMFQSMDAIRKLSTNTPSNNSSDSAPNSAIGVPVFLSQRAPSRNDPFPSSPFTTPLKEKVLTDEDEEQVLYPATTARPRTPYGNQLETFDREISWVASPVPEIRMPIDDDEDEDDVDQDDDVAARSIEVLPAEPEEEEAPLSATSSRFSPEAYDDTSPRVSSRSSKSVILEPEMLPENAHLYAPASPLSAAQPHVSDDGSISPQFFPTRLSIASRIHSVGDRSPIAGEFPEFEDRSPKRTETSTWEKVKNTFTRAGSNSGRRSRTNSIVTRERRDHTDSSVSRESGVSLTSSKTDKGEQTGTSATVHAPAIMQIPSASTSILSLAPHVPPRGSVSPIPPASSTDMSRYQNAKLFPFPGMLKLEEERRAKGYPSATASSPDVSLHSNVIDDPHASPMAYSLSTASSQTQDGSRERKLSHQNSDTRLFVKYGGEPLALQPPSPQHAEYIDLSSPQQNGGGYNLTGKLPMTLPGVKQWLKNSRKKTASPPGSASGTVTFASLPVPDSQVTPITNKKPSLSDLFPKKDGEVVSDWEDASGMPTVNEVAADNQQAVLIGSGSMSNGSKASDAKNTLEIDQTPKIQNVGSPDLGSRRSPYAFFPDSLVLPSPGHATPDPSSLSDYPAPTPSESSSTTSSQYSLGIHQGSVILERIEEHLARGFKSPMWSSAIDDPPRKLILSSPVLQVLNPNTVKDRFLFLFNDILVIAKPVAYDQDNLIDSTYKPDRKYAVKSVVQLRNLRFCADRSEAQGKMPSTSGPGNPIMRTFISQFVKDPDYAISSLFSKTNIHDNPTLLGQILFRTLELDRTQLGDYLYRRTSRSVLKSYLDSFGFAGLRVDVALRVFLHSVNVPSQYALEHLLESFAARWYEANAKSVAYDRDMAVRLVSALVQLNDRLHGGISDEPGPTSHTMRKVTSKEFQDAFRRIDPRNLVPDELLQDLYRSIFHERLCQACASASGSQDTIITVKRPLPTRLNLKVQSEPIVLRLPQSDPLLSIELFGQDLIFDPPILHFSRSSEASFRVTGTSLGSKTITLCRSGPNATKYSGLPLSHNVDVERAFMKNTFQIAFLTSLGAKRRYMFSVDDTIIRNEWATCLRRQIDLTLANISSANGAASLTTAKFKKAADAVAFKVLQETLMGRSTPSSSPANGSYPRPNGSNGLTTSSIPFTTGPLHIRSKSGNKIYEVVKSELDFGHRSQNSSRESNDYHAEAHANTPDQRPDGLVWTSRELEMQCQQNSSIALVLSFLHVGTAEPSAS
ncbi:unnamed protein product [Cyclocybe aegerita]|uniref:SEC7 domain-containing protein n=1 Tax=Cyclocybe aegerita TaxID=1973307 RepID=A0A8S0XK70_CYCAE|nr:unnamed protein product [Cyclocybe aegerita]